MALVKVSELVPTIDPLQTLQNLDWPNPRYGGNLYAAVACRNVLRVVGPWMEKKLHSNSG